MLEQWIKFRLGQPSHGKKKLRMLLDLMVRKHYPVPLEEENGSMLSSSQQENNAEMKRVPLLFDLSELFTIMSIGVFTALNDKQIEVCAPPRQREQQQGHESHTDDV